MFARYLLDRDPPDDIVERYVAAIARLFPGDPAPGDAALLRFVNKNPSSLPFVDAAPAVLRPESQLRKRILTMAAILEASVYYADEFLALPPGRARTVLRLAALGISAGVKFVIGAFILALIPGRADPT